MIKYTRILIILYCAVSATFSQSDLKKVESKHFLYGCPLGTPQSNNLIIRDIYALSSNDSTKFADWVAYRLDLITITGNTLTKRNWKADPLLKDEETLEPGDYKKAYEIYKYERGHLAPLASFKGSSKWFEANYLSNITPQKSNLNQGPWKVLEENERNLLKKFNFIYVITGTLYETYMPNLPEADESHIVPSGFWKIILIPDSNFICYPCSFIMNQDIPKKSDLFNYIANINQIESKTGLDFLWKLEDSVEETIESKINFKWCKENLK